MKGLVGAPCWWGAWGPGPLPPLLNPALSLLNHSSTNIHHSVLPNDAQFQFQCMFRGEPVLNLAVFFGNPAPDKFLAEFTGCQSINYG